MKLIGLLGGMSWESTEYYYRQLNVGVRERLGGLHSARCLLLSLDFAQVERLQAAGDWDEAAALLAEGGRALQAGGAECVVLCTNTMHRVHAQLQAAVEVPVLHIADGTATALQGAGVTRVGLLGTRYTMEHEFYRGRLEARGLDVIIPAAVDRVLVHKVIYDELCMGRVLEKSREAFRAVAARLADDGAEAVVLGCTEIGLLIGQADCPVPVFDTTLLHVQAALDFALG